MFFKKTQSEIVKEQPKNEENLRSFDMLRNSQLQMDKQIAQHQIVVVQGSVQTHPKQSTEQQLPKQLSELRKIQTQLHKRQKLSSSIKQTISKRSRLSSTYTKRSYLGESIFPKIKRSQKQCGICLGSVIRKDLIYLCKCQHFYCKNCMMDYVSYKIKMFQEVLCPDEKCDAVMDQEKEFYTSLKDELKQKYIKIHNFYKTSNDPSLRLCPKQNCNGVIKILQNQPRICDTCKKQFCPKCFFQSHSGTCQKMQNDFFHNNLHYRKCGKCKIVIQRTEGCNHMTCKCKYEFCYECGRKWEGNGHLCTNPIVVEVEEEIPGLFDNQGTCSCLQCLVGDDCWKTAFRGFFRVASTIGFTLFVLLLSIFYTFKIVGYMIFTIFVGLIKYPVMYICNLCEQKIYPMIAYFIVTYPISMLIGAANALAQMMPPFIVAQCTSFTNIVKNGYEHIWK